MDKGGGGGQQVSQWPKETKKEGQELELENMLS